MVNSIMGSILARGLPYRAVALLIPVLVVIIHIGIMAATLPQTMFFTMLGLMVTYLLPPAGKETVIPIGIALGIPWWYMALSIVMIDVETGLFMALNFDLSYSIPFLGPLLSDLTKQTEQFITCHPWFAGLWFFAIVLMVMVPVLGSGGIRGSIAGKILGINNLLVFLAILVGALIGCFGIALGSNAILTHLCLNGTLPAEIGARVCGGG
ncbi:MAG: small multi-drug export protein [Methanoregula sp.]|nr:small multi-drug export protein [Methanoregula sp.]